MILNHNITGFLAQERLSLDTLTQPLFRKIDDRMNTTQLKCLAVMSVFVIIGFGPVSITCLIGIYVVIFRPTWLLILVRKLYQDIPNCKTYPSTHPSITRLKALFVLLILLILDIAPVPVTGTIGMFVILLRPLWFLSLVEDVYTKP